jgi:hypothetical protein
MGAKVPHEKTTKRKWPQSLDIAQNGEMADSPPTISES